MDVETDRPSFGGNVPENTLLGSLLKDCPTLPMTMEDRVQISTKEFPIFITVNKYTM